MIKHLIFDCFGTLIDNLDGSVQATQVILGSVGRTELDARKFYAEWKALKKEMMANEPFVTEKEFYALSLAAMFERYGIDADARLEVKPMIDWLFAYRPAYPDVKEGLEVLRAMGLETVIGSTTDDDSINHYLSLNGIGFGRMFTSENMRVYKPVPLFYETILKTTGWEPSECLFIGDTYEDDVCGPKKAGMKACLARFGGDEFMIMSFFAGDGEAEAFRQALSERFLDFTEKEKLPYPLHISVGWSRYEPGMSLEKLTELADEQLYLEKKRKNVKR